MKNAILILCLFFCTTCTTYDNALVYHKNFEPGFHSLLRFDGFYTDSLGPKPNPASAAAQYESIKPVFFYSNGSAFSCDNYTSDFALLNPNGLDGSWGNYKVSSDTIVLEKFRQVENNYVRVITKGIISENSIRWFTRKYHREDYKPVEYSVFFSPFKTKPDSTNNFTRTLPVYNK